MQRGRVISQANLDVPATQPVRQRRRHGETVRHPRIRDRIGFVDRARRLGPVLIFPGEDDAAGVIVQVLELHAEHMVCAIGVLPRVGYIQAHDSG